MRRILFPLLMLIALSSSAQGEKEIIYAEAKKLADAILAGDFETVVDYTHPNLLEKMGGRQAMLQTLEVGLLQMEQNGLGFDQVEIGQPKKIYRTGEELFALVPQTLDMKAPDGRIRTKSHLLAISPDNGATWYFLDTAQLDNERALQLLPKFNPDLKIPTPRKPVFLPD